MSNSDLTAFDEFKAKLPTTDKEKLCEIIACFKYLGCLKEEALACMVELAARRKNGDDFNFEERIQKMIESLPIFKIDLQSTIGGPGLAEMFGKLGLNLSKNRK
jgi:hypothetical protein